MMSVLNIPLPQAQLAEFCQRWQISELALFGSVLRDDFQSHSDIDILITFAPEAKRGAFVLAQMQTELETLWGREVDLVSRFVGWVSDSVTHAGEGFRASTLPLDCRVKPPAREALGVFSP